MENSPAKQTSKITKGERRYVKAEAKHAKKVNKAVEKGNKAVEKADKMANKQSAQEERTKRIGIRQGERTRRVEARHSSPAKQTLGESVGKGIDMYTDNVIKPVGRTIKKGIDMYTDKVVKPAMELPSKAIDAITPKVSKPRERKYDNASPAAQTGETVNTAGQVIPTGIGDAAPNNAFNASVTPPQPNRAGAPPRNTANLNMGIGVDPNRSNFRNNQVANNAALAGGGNVPGMQVPQTMAAKKGKVKGFANNVKEIMKTGKSKEAATKILAAATWKHNPGKMKK